MGHTVFGKTISVDYKTKKRRKAKADELIIFKNTHEAIIKKNSKKKSKVWNNITPIYRTFNLFRLWRKVKLQRASRT